MIHIANERAREKHLAAGSCRVGCGRLGRDRTHRRRPSTPPVLEQGRRPVRRTPLLAVSIAAAVVFLPYAVDTVGALTRKDNVGSAAVCCSRSRSQPASRISSFHPIDTDFAPFVLVFAARRAWRPARADRPILGVIGDDPAAAPPCSPRRSSAPTRDSFIWVIGISFGWFGGFSWASSTHAERRAEARERRSSRRRRRPTSAQRIAREVHDVIAHSLSVTMLHVTAARMALQRGPHVRRARSAAGSREAGPQQPR